MRRYVFCLAMLGLAVLGPTAAVANDQQIAEQIIQKLQAEKQAGTLKGFSIDLQVDEGTVWLSGRVATPEQQAKALDIARRIPGVTQVVNDLTVTPPAPSPASIKNPFKTLASARRTDTAAPPQVQSAAAAASPPPAPPKPAPPKPAVSAPVAIAPEPAEIGFPSPIGSGVDASSTVASRQTVVQTAPPIASLPSPAVTTASLPVAAQPVATANLPAASAPQPYAQVAPQPLAVQAIPVPVPVPVYAGTQSQVPLAFAPAQTAGYAGAAGPMHTGMQGAPVPMHLPGSGVGIAPARYDHPTMPCYAWPSYAAYPNYAAVTYPKQYSPAAWPYIGPFYPYPQVPLGWRKVTLEWDDGWWMLDFKDRRSMYNH